MIFLTSITVTVEEVMCLIQIRRSSGGGLIILSSCSLGEVCSWVAGLYLPSDLRRRLAIMRKTTAPTTAMNNIPPTMGPTIMAMSPKARDCKNRDTQHCLKKDRHFASLSLNLSLRDCGFSFVPQPRNHIGVHLLTPDFRLENKGRAPSGESKDLLMTS